MKIRDVMTPDPAVCDAGSHLRDAAAVMRDRNIGDVLVKNDDGLCGIVTDRDLVVRGLAGDRDPDEVTLGEVCSKELHSISVDADTDAVVAMMRDHALRRVPVMDGDRAVGIVSLGDLATNLDHHSVLGRISGARPDS